MIRIQTLIQLLRMIIRIKSAKRRSNKPQTVIINRDKLWITRNINI